MKKRNSEKLAKARDELKQVEKAIAAILRGAQSYRIGTRSISRADLTTLYKRKDALEDLVTALSGGAGRFRRVVPVG